MEKNYPANCHVLCYADDNAMDQRRANAVKYWCNALGELHKHGKHDIDEHELPKPLRRAYNELWEESAGGCNTYLVETDAGYGIGLVGEYDETFAKDCGLTMDELWETLLEDMENLAALDELWSAQFYALEMSGFDECHELVIFLPAMMPKADFDAACKAIERTMYTASKNWAHTSTPLAEYEDGSSLVMRKDKDQYEIGYVPNQDAYSTYHPLVTAVVDKENEELIVTLRDAKSGQPAEKYSYHLRLLQN